MNASNVEEMFFSIIDQITSLQQAKKKKIAQEDDDIMPPLTTENLTNSKTGNTVVETPTVKLIKT